MSILIPIRIYKVRPLIPHWWGWRIAGWTYLIVKTPHGLLLSQGGYVDRPIHLRRFSWLKEQR